MKRVSMAVLEKRIKKQLREVQINSCFHGAVLFVWQEHGETRSYIVQGRMGVRSQHLTFGLKFTS